MPSARSAAIVSLSLTMLLIGINAQSGWLFWLAGLLIAALFVAWIDSFLQVRNLEAERALQPEAFEEETLEITLRVRHRGRFQRHLLVVVDGHPGEEDPPRRIRLKAPRRRLGEILREGAAPEKSAGPVTNPAGGGLTPLLLFRLAPGEEVTFSYRRGGLRRGVYRSWPVYFYSEGTLGLSRHCSRVDVPSRLTVFPSYAEISTLPLMETLPYVSTVPRYVAARGDGLDFYGVREFRPGDSLSRVHWRTTARIGDLVVQEYEREQGFRLLVLLDNRDRGDGREARYCLDVQARVAATVARFAMLSGYPVTLAAYRGSEPVTYDAPGFHAALHWLATLEAEGALEPEGQLAGVSPVITAGTLVCQIMAADGAPVRPKIHALPRACRLAWILVEAGPRNGRRKAAKGGEAGARLAELLSNPPAELVGLALYREGEDLKKCLENPLLSCIAWRRPGR